MDIFEYADLLKEQQGSRKLYYEFIKESALSMGVYVLPAGSIDPQQPHDRDEVYYVAEGRGMITVAREVRPVKPGSIVYVPAMVEHRFHTIEETLKVLVFFAAVESR